MGGQYASILANRPDVGLQCHGNQVGWASGARYFYGPVPPERRFLINQWTEMRRTVPVGVALNQLRADLEKACNEHNCDVDQEPEK